MYNTTTGQSGVLFGNTQPQNVFGQTPNQQTGFFGSANTGVVGTTVKYIPHSGTDVVQKNNQSTTVQTKLLCISAMKEYEGKSLEELRYEDYSANRITPQKSLSTGLFGGNQTSTGLFNSSQTSMFPSNVPFGSSQQTQLGSGTQSNLFGSSTQNNAFGSKNLFGSPATPTSSAFGTFSSQSKPSLFGMNTSTANKPLFGSPQPTQSSSLFGGTQQSSPSLFGNQTPNQPAPLFGGASQQNPSTGLFNSNTSTSSFGFQSSSTPGLFGNNNTSKPFGGTNSSFTFPNSSAPTNTSLFGTSTGSLFSQNTTNTGFGNTSKPSLFSTTGSFSSAISSPSQNNFQQASTGFNQPGNLFGNQQKTNTFGNTTPFNNQAKPGLFGATNTTPNNRGSMFSTFGSNQPFNSTITTSTIAPVNNTFAMGVTTPAEALYQQQMMQQKILSLVSNRPYGVNKLFMGQHLNDEIKATATESSTNNTNLLSLAIKRNEMDKTATNQRRRILNQKTKLIPNHAYKVFSGFDEDEELSIKSSSVDNFFFVKREDWKYLPPTAFEKSRKSTPAHNTSVTNDKILETGISTPICTVSQFMRDTSGNYCSTPLTDSVSKKTESIQTSPVRSGKRSPTNYVPLKHGDSIVNTSKLADESINQLDSPTANRSVSKLKESNIMPPNDDNEKRFLAGDNKHRLVKEDKIQSPIKEQSCMVKLSREGYYTIPSINTMNKFVTVDEFGQKNCIVKDFIIGRKGYGSIRFPGHTDVYGLCLDDLVDIHRKEVSVYPDENNKPDEGDELNKLAQVTLTQVWPVDKSSGVSITDESRLKIMNFEDKLKRSTERLGARFISYAPEEGSWVFEVDHFSKYTYMDSDEEDDDTPQNTTQTENKTLNYDLSTKRELTKRVDISNTTKTDVVLAEADSMSTLYPPKSQLHKFLNPLNTRNVNMKQAFSNFDMDEESYNHPNASRNNNLQRNELKLDKDQPRSKRFETREMGERIRMSPPRSMMDYSSSAITLFDNDKLIKHEDNKRPIKPLTAERVAPTLEVASSNRSIQNTQIPNYMRDIRSRRMPYLYNRLVKYFDNVTVDMHKSFSKNVALVQANRFRVGFHSSRNSTGLKFFKINSSESVSSPFNASLKKLTPNALMIIKSNHSNSLPANVEYKRKMMEAALRVAECSVNPDTKCPLWTPTEGLNVLNCYLKTHSELKTGECLEATSFRRIINLCDALWNDLGEKQDTLPSYMNDLGRKQRFSKWIRSECRDKLMQHAESILKSPSGFDADKCNTVILNALCSGEIGLASRLATIINEHRLSLLIAQSGSDLQGREMIKEQLNIWTHSKTDRDIPWNILCIYMVLSGQTNIALSDGSVLAPFKQMSWIQALGAHFWFMQPYMGSIKSAIDLYDDAFKTELDIPAPYPMSVGGASDLEDDEYSFYDCCYHLIKLYCDRIYELNTVLNPPTMSRHDSHKLSCDWSGSWHLANVLTALGFGGSAYLSSKICAEWGAQLERDGLWQWAALVLLHIGDENLRTRLVKQLINRHVTHSPQLTEQEQFLIDQLHIPAQWVHESKAIRCKAMGNAELEAFHWLQARQFDRSHQIYMDQIVPNLLISDKFDQIATLLQPFVHTDAYKSMASWPLGGQLILQYIHIVSSLRTLQLTNKLANHSILLTATNPSMMATIDNDESMITTVDDDINRLTLDVNTLVKAIHSYQATSNAQRICKQQIQSLCTRFLQAACSIEIV